MLTMLDAAEAQSGATSVEVPASAATGAAGLVAAVVSRLVADGCIVSHAAIAAKMAAAKETRKATIAKPKSRWDDDDDMEDMFVDTSMGKEWGGPTRGGRMPEPTRFGDWERKGRATDF